MGSTYLLVIHLWTVFGSLGLPRKAFSDLTWTWRCWVNGPSDTRAHKIKPPGLRPWILGSRGSGTRVVARNPTTLALGVRMMPIWNKLLQIVLGSIDSPLLCPSLVWVRHVGLFPGVGKFKQAVSNSNGCLNWWEHFFSILTPAQRLTSDRIPSATYLWHICNQLFEIDEVFHFLNYEGFSVSRIHSRIAFSPP